MSTDLDPIENVTQRTVPASAAAPSQPTGPNSVFALGKTITGAVVDEAEQMSARGEAAGADLRPVDERMLELLGAAGGLSRRMLCQNLGIGMARCLEELASLMKHKKVVQTGKGRATAYHLAGGGFKGWLKRNGEESAEGRAKPRKRAASVLKQRVSKALAKPKAPSTAPSLVHAPIEPNICCGLFSNRDLQIEAGGQQMRLDRAQTRHLVEYLLKVDAAFQSGAA